MADTCPAMRMRAHAANKQRVDDGDDDAGDCGDYEEDPLMMTIMAMTMLMIKIMMMVGEVLFGSPLFGLYVGVCVGVFID